MLTDAKVRKLTKPGRYSAGRDAFGLSINVHRASDGSITRSWVQRIAVGGKRRSVGLGAFPLVLAQEAQEAAFENCRTARAGDDIRKPRASAIPTVADAFESYIASSPTWGESTVKGWRSTLAAHIEPSIGAMRVSAVGHADVKALVGPIWHSKPAAAKDVLRRLEIVMESAIGSGYRTDNPVPAVRRSMPRQDRKVTNRKAVPHERMAETMETIRTGEGSEIVKLALRFVVLTVARPHLVRSMTWGEIEIGEGGQWTWTIPAERMKARRAHRVPLSDEAVRVLKEADKLAEPEGDGSLVFPSSRGSVMADKTLTRILDANGIDADVHGFRASFRTWALDTRKPAELVKAAMAHRLGDDATEAAYIRTDLFEDRRALMEAWAEHVIG